MNFIFSNEIVPYRYIFSNEKVLPTYIFSNEKVCFKKNRGFGLSLFLRKLLRGSCPCRPMLYAFCPTCLTRPTCPTSAECHAYATRLKKRNRKNRSNRQIDPAFAAAVAGRIGRLVDQFREVVENAAISLRIVVIDERLPSDHLDPALSTEKLTGDAAFLLKINEFEHNETPRFPVVLFRFYLKTILRIRTSAPGYRAAI